PCTLLSILPSFLSFLSFFFNATATTEIYTLSLHDALPISQLNMSLNTTTCYNQTKADQLDIGCVPPAEIPNVAKQYGVSRKHAVDRKSTRLNSSHSQISYAVFCLKKKKKKKKKTTKNNITQ